MASKQQQKNNVSARPVQMATYTMEYVMPPLGNNCTATEELCFLRGRCRDAISKTVSEDLVSH
jgi:hypothetical protein